MAPQIENIRGQFEAIRGDAAELTKGLSEAQLKWRPAPGRWSIVDNLAHLNRVDGLDVAQLYRLIADSRKQGLTGQGPFRWKLWERWFLRLMEPPYKMKAPAPKVYEPPPDPDCQSTLAEFEQIQHDLYYLVAEADGLHLRKIQALTPVNNWMKMSLGARLELITAHDRRHLWQARQVRGMANFPAA